MFEDIEDNITRCSTYIPDIDEYYDALGWLWVFFVVIGVLTCMLLYGLFLEQLVGAVQNAQRVFRNSLIWIASVYPFMTLMTIIGFIIPRSQQVCFTVKSLYMMIGISKFTDLTLLMYGSEEVMLWTIKDSEIKFNHGPVCCCLFCIKPFRITKMKLRMIIAGIQQLPFTQTFFLIMIMILQAANEVVIGSLDPSGSYFWLNLFSFLTSILGVFCLNLLSFVSLTHLQRYSYNKISFVMKALIIVTKLQSLVFNVMAYYEIFPCIPPISHYVYRETVENYFYIFEMLIFGLYSYKIYRNISFETSNPSFIKTDARGNVIPHHTAYIPSLRVYSGEQPGPLNASSDILDDRDESVKRMALEEALRNGTSPDIIDFSGGMLMLDDDSPPSSHHGYVSFI